MTRTPEVVVLEIPAPRGPREPDGSAGSISGPWSRTVRPVTHTLRVTVALRWLDPPAGPAIELLDQTRLPAIEAFVTCADVPTLIDAIARLVVRGAPLLGIVGAYGVALAAARGDDV